MSDAPKYIVTDEYGDYVCTMCTTKKEAVDYVKEGGDGGDGAYAIYQLVAVGEVQTTVTVKDVGKGP